MSDVVPDPHFQYEDPDWEPLVTVVGEELAGEFMWMNQCGSADGAPVQAYKHYWTRRYLYLDGELNAYRWGYIGAADHERLCRVSLDAAVEECFAGCSALGTRREAVAAWRELIKQIWAGSHPTARRPSS